MNHEKMREQVHTGIDRQCASLTSDPYRVQRVLNMAHEAQTTGGFVVKKKLSVGFVFIMILILTMATALAIGLSNYFDSFASLEDSYGEYEQWPNSAKIRLVQVMVESELPLNLTLVERMESISDEKEAARIADTIITEYFGGDMKMDTYNVMLHELGAFDRWSVEDKAYYSSLLVEYGKHKDDWPMYLLPEEGAPSESEVIQAASDVLIDKFDAALDLNRVSVSYVKNESMYGANPVWIVAIGSAQNIDRSYTVILDAMGNVLTYNAPYEHSYTLETDVLDESRIATPGEWDISEEEAIRIGLEALVDIGVYEDHLQEINVQAYFVYNDRFCSGCEPVWLLHFTMNDEFVYKMVLRHDGTYLASVSADQEFEGVRRDDGGVGADLIDLDFRNMSVEEKAAFSEKWNPIVNEYLSSHPYYPNYNGLMYQATRQVYGIPGEGDMTQEEATQIAQNEILRLGASSNTLMNRRMLYTYDVTEPMNPLWKVLIYHVAFDGMPDEPIASDYISYQVVIDGNTGEILRCIDNTHEGFDGFNK